MVTVSYTHLDVYKRQASYSEAIARAMHKSPSFVADVKTAALLHDV